MWVASKRSDQAEGSICGKRIHVLQWTGSYMVPFFIAAYLVALLLIHTLSPAARALRKSD